jgi:hypothetical protein
MRVPTATKIGRAFDLKVEAEPTVESDAQPPAVPATPAVIKSAEKVVEFDGDWLDCPSVEGQATKYPQSIRITGLVTDVFSLSAAGERAAYNEIHGRATPKNPTVVVVKDQVHFSEKTGEWCALLQYRKIQFRRIAPDKSEKN